MAEMMGTRVEFEGLDMNRWRLDMGFWSSKEKSRLEEKICKLPACRLFSS